MLSGPRLDGGTIVWLLEGPTDGSWRERDPSISRLSSILVGTAPQPLRGSLRVSLDLGCGQELRHRRGPLAVLAQQRHQLAPQPFQIVGQNADEEMSAQTLRTMCLHRAQLRLGRLQRAEEPLHALGPIIGWLRRVCSEGLFG